MRIAIVVAPSVGRVHGLIGHPARLRMEIEDRRANGEGFPDERVIRLPKRYSRIPYVRQTILWNLAHGLGLRGVTAQTLSYSGVDGSAGRYRYRMEIVNKIEKGRAVGTLYGVGEYTRTGRRRGWAITPNEDELGTRRACAKLSRRAS